MVPVYTIGHSTRKAEDFLALLQKFGIEYLADVRSRPYSRFNPQYNREALKKFLEENDIRYVFMGDELGGRPEAPSCYTPEGKLSYELVKTAGFFREGIERLKTAYEKQVKIALMCSEGKPSECHRGRLIGAVLAQENIPVVHIDEKGNLKDQDTVWKEIRKDISGTDLFHGM